MITAHLPQRYFMPDRVRLRSAIPAIDGTDDEFLDGWLLHGSQLVAIRGGAGAGKTSVATGIMIDVITRQYADLVNPKRYLFVNAMVAFQEIARMRFAEESLGTLITEVGLLVIDNIHMLESRDVLRMCAYVMDRCDNGKATIVTMSPKFEIDDSSFQLKVFEGRTVIL